MHVARKLVLAGAIVVLSACSTLSSLNPFSGKGAPRNPPAELTEFKQSMPVRAAWSVSVGSAADVDFSPAVLDGNVYAASADGTIVRIEGLSGNVAWRVNAGAKLTGGVGVGGNIVVVAAEKGVLLAYDLDGKQRWKTQAPSEVLSAPAVAGGVVIAHSVDNRITAFDADSGNKRWTVQRTAPALTLRSAPGIAVSGLTAYAALPGGRLLAVAANNGGPRWETLVGEPRGATELERIADVSGTPLVLGRDVCAVAFQGRIACFDAATGAARWAKDFSSNVGLAGDERFVFAADDQGAVSAFARETGASVWRSTKLANRRLSTPLSFGRAVAVGDYQGYIHFLSREDGTMLARIATDGSQVIGTPQVVRSYAVFQTQAGTVVALSND
jgi:outer membrane protein assembly factor BamB